MRRFFSTDLPIPNRTVLLTSEVSHHILRVVGVAPNEKIELFDGRGKGCIVALESVEQGQARVRFCQELDSVAQGTSLWMLLSLTKGDAFSTALRMLTEVGVDHIIPVLTERSIAKGEKLERWRRIVTSSAAQCKRVTIPTVYSLCSLSEALALVESVENRFVLHPGEEKSLLPSINEAALLIGPEGGFSEREITFCRNAGWIPVGIHSLVLRADTAAVTAAIRFLR